MQWDGDYVQFGDYGHAGEAGAGWAADHGSLQNFHGLLKH